MRELQKSDRYALDIIFKENAWDSFYHHFPILYAISESTEKIKVDDNGPCYYVGDDLYYPPVFFGVLQKIPRGVSKVWVSINKCPFSSWKTELYDVNFIYDLDITLKIKNFRKNVKKFTRDNKGVEYKSVESKDFAWEVVKEWYQKSNRKEFTDFGYTRWLTWNYDEFPDLNARLVSVEEEPVAFSLWGKLNDEMGIHLVCKDVGWPYLQDYARYMTYSEMRDKGFKFVNDGGDAGEEGIRIYKLKLRPKFIIPVYSWVRE